MQPNTREVDNKIICVAIEHYTGQNS